MMEELIKRALYEFANRTYLKNIYDYYEEISWIDPKKLTDKYLKEIIDFSKKNNEYYKKLFAKKDKLADLPVLTKNDIRANFDSLTSKSAGDDFYKNSSGGSTGKPITLLQDQLYRRWSNATEMMYYRNFLNTDYPTVKKVVLWGSERDAQGQKDIRAKIYNYISNTVFLNTFNANEKQWLDYIDVINRERPYFVKGYAGSLYQLAKIAKRNNKKLFTPHYLYSSAELLRDFMRKEIEEVFDAKVYDYYGSREVGAISGECRYGHKHIFTYNNFVEVVDIDSKSGMGKILITNLHNHIMPLLRYEIGDTGIVSKEKCSCGSDLPWFEQIYGRITDHFISKDGTLIHGEYFTHLFYYKEWVDEFQVNQIERCRIEILYVGHIKANQIEMSEIENKIRKIMKDESSEIVWKKVESIPRTAQGKFLFTRCLIDN